jgi:hypothetical protein
MSSRSSRTDWLLKGCLLMLFLSWGVVRVTLVAIQVPGASQLIAHTSSDGKKYLRNVNSFDPRALGCCYNDYMDTTTSEGKNIFVIWLPAAARASRTMFFMPDSYSARAL